MSKPGKALRANERETLERTAMRCIEHIEQASTADELEGAREMVGYYVDDMVQRGYHPVAAEGFRARARRAGADAQVRLGAAEEVPSTAGRNAAGLEVSYFVVRLKSMLSIIQQYTPAEFARECARLARRADPRVLSEDEFQ